MPCKAMITAQGSSSTGPQRLKPSRAPSKLTKASGSSLGPVNPAAGTAGRWTRGAQPAAPSTAASANALAQTAAFDIQRFMRRLAKRRRTLLRMPAQENAARRAGERKRSRSRERSGLEVRQQTVEAAVRGRQRLGEPVVEQRLPARSAWEDRTPDICRGEAEGSRN